MGWLPFQLTDSRATGDFTLVVYTDAPAQQQQQQQEQGEQAERGEAGEDRASSSADGLASRCSALDAASNAGQVVVRPVTGLERRRCGMRLRGEWSNKGDFPSAGGSFHVRRCV